jgi:hypothetical protein
MVQLYKSKTIGARVFYIEQIIFLVRAQKIKLGRDLAAIYGVPTFRFNEAVKRNMRKNMEKVKR